MKVSSFLAVLTLGAVAGVMMSEYSPEIKKMLKKRQAAAWRQLNPIKRKAEIGFPFLV